MPDAVVLDAGRTYLDAGVIGASAVFLMVALWWAVRQWLTALKALDAEKDARLSDAKEFAAAGEAMRNAMQANTSAIQSILEIVRDRGRA